MYSNIEVNVTANISPTLKTRFKVKPEGVSIYGEFPGFNSAGGVRVSPFGRLSLLKTGYKPEYSFGIDSRYGNWRIVVR